MRALLRDGQVGFTRERYRTLLDVAEAMALHRELGESFQEFARRLPRIIPRDHINLVRTADHRPGVVAHRRWRNACWR